MNTIQSINGTALPIDPIINNGFSVTTSDLDSEASGRSAETGILLRYVVRSGVYKISLSFRGQASDIAAVRTLVSPALLHVVFWDLTEWKEADMYVSDRSVKLLPVVGQNGWYDLSFNLIEY